MDRQQQTSVPGLYVLGDVVSGLSQISVASGHATSLQPISTPARRFRGPSDRTATPTQLAGPGIHS